LKILFCGDIVGRSGRDAVVQHVPKLRQSHGLDFVIANGENAAAGFGINAKICQELHDAGVDVITSGNHIWGQRDLLLTIDQHERLLRPINYPAGTPGHGMVTVTNQAGKRLTVVNVMGRVFMDVLDDPFAAIEAALTKTSLAGEAIFVDIHAEATSEKAAMAYMLDGRVSAVVGTHTHVPTADARVLPKQTAFRTDTGMCGDYNSIIGMQPPSVLHRFLRKYPGPKMVVSEGPGTLSATLITLDSNTHLAKAIEAVWIPPA
jgi:metallophosphoesterase (TIGR00282 family)